MMWKKFVKRMDPYRDIIKELLKKEEGWIAELDSLKKELVDKTLHILKEDNKREEMSIKVLEEYNKGEERSIKVLEELKELLQDEMKELIQGLKNECPKK